MILRDVGNALRRAGLTQNALLAWSGTHRISTWPWKLSGFTKLPITPAASTLALFVGGIDRPLAHLRGLPIDALVEHGLIEVAGDHARARLAILPLEQTLIVCDRIDADTDPEDEGGDAHTRTAHASATDAHASDTATETVARRRRELVCWPDDSSYHLATALAPGRRERWIDLATGSAFAPLARPALAHAIVGIDLNPRAVKFARLGAALSGCEQIDVHCHDIGEIKLAPAPLVTCNAPILGDPDPAMWRSTDPPFFDRMWRSIRACVAPGGEAVVHCVTDGIPDELDGDVTTIVYTPPGERAYAVTWWSPDAPARRTLRHRELTAARPHIDPADRAPSL